MTMNGHVVDVSEATFQAEVIEKSKTTPVVVDFWAAWCGPCRMLGPTLEKLANEANGAWILAKVDVDQNQGLSMRYGVQGIPAVKAFVDGDVADEFVGAQPEPMVRQFIERLAPSKEAELLKEAQEIEEAGGYEAAESLYQQVLQTDTHNAKALLGLGRVQIELGMADEATETLQRVPIHERAGRSEAEGLLARIEFQRVSKNGGGLEAAQEKLASNPGDVDARYEVATAFAAQGRYVDALEHLLMIVQTDRAFKDDAARTDMISIFNMLGDENPATQDYRSKLAMAIF